MRTKKKIYRQLFAIFLDLIFVIFSFVAAFFVRVGQFQSSDFPFENYFRAALFVAPIFVIFYCAGGLYFFREKNFTEKLRVIFLSNLAGATLFVLTFFFLREIFFSRAIVVLIFFFATFFVFAAHFFRQKLADRNFRAGKNVDRILIVGSGRAAGKLIEHLRANFPEKKPVAILAPYGSKSKIISNVKILGKLDALERVVKSEKISEIWQTEAVEQSLNLVNFCESNFLQFRAAGEILGFFSAQFSVADFGGRNFLNLEFSPLFGWGQFFKRAVDVAAAIAVFPIFIVIFFGKKIAGDEVLKRENFVGSRGVSISLFEFRGKKFKNFPRILNLFRGEISLTGPKIRTEKEFENLPENFRRRLFLRPGIFSPAENSPEAEIFFIKNWSFRRDLKILFRAIFEQKF